MKKLLRLTLVSLLLSLPYSVVAQDYMTVIASKGCECLEKLQGESEKQNINMKLGFCMLEAAQPYAKELKRDHKIDLAKLDTQGEELGKIVGLKMAGVCPSTFMTFIETTGADKDEEGTAVKDVEGKITSISEQQFIVFTMQEETGKTSNFIWLNYFPTKQNLTNDYNKLLNKKVKLTFVEEEFFDPRIKEFKKFNVIAGLEVI